VRAILLFTFFAFVLSMGCISNQAFTSTDIRNPCSIVSADEISSICGFGKLDAVPIYDDLGDGFVYSRCVYMPANTTANVSGAKCDDDVCFTGGSSPFFFILQYIPHSDLTYAEYKEVFSTNQTSLVKEDIGIGEKSFIGKSTDEDNKTVSIFAVAFKGSSRVWVTAEDANLSDKCFNDEKTEQITALAFSRLVNKSK